MGLGTVLVLVGCGGKSYDIATQPEVKKGEDLYVKPNIKTEPPDIDMRVTLADGVPQKDKIGDKELQESLSIGETLEVDGLYVTVNSVETREGKKETLEDNFKEIVTVNITYQNMGKDLQKGNDFTIYNNLINKNYIELDNDFNQEIPEYGIINGSIKYGSLESEDTNSLVLGVSKRNTQGSTGYIELYRN